MTGGQVSRGSGWYPRHSEAESHIAERGCVMAMYCDNCGDEFAETELRHYEELPCAVSSALAGESGSLCRKCDEDMEAECS